jgi:TPR repeat protein
MYQVKKLNTALYLFAALSLTNYNAPTNAQSSRSGSTDRSTSAGTTAVIRGSSARMNRSTADNMTWAELNAALDRAELARSAELARLVAAQTRSPSTVRPAVSVSPLTAGNAAYAGGKYAEAATLFEQACTANDPEGCYRLGNMYFYGVYFLKNNANATKFIQTSCSKGFQPGCSQLKIVETENQRFRKIAEQNREYDRMFGPNAASKTKFKNDPSLHACLKEVYSSRTDCYSASDSCNFLSNQVTNSKTYYTQNKCSFSIKVTAIGGMFGQPTDFIMKPGSVHTPFVGITEITRWK